MNNIIYEISRQVVNCYFFNIAYCTDNDTRNTILLIINSKSYSVTKKFSQIPQKVSDLTAQLILINKIPVYLCSQSFLHASYVFC